MSLTFYPNPSNDFINVKTENGAKLENFHFFDLNDKIDIATLSQGAYLLKAKVNGALISKKIIKK